MKIIIETIDHEAQRYSTVGDYYYDDEGTLHIKISRLGDEYMERMVAVHEILEEALVKKANIPIRVIDEFDIMYETERNEGLHREDEEPGFDERSPYLDMHTFATSQEMAFCSKLGYSWADYSNKVNSL